MLAMVLTIEGGAWLIAPWWACVVLLGATVVQRAVSR